MFSSHMGLDFCLFVLDHIVQSVVNRIADPWVESMITFVEIDHEIM